MAKIKKMPGLKIINGFKGILDYYFYMGIACVRKWPSKPTKIRSEAVRAQWANWRFASQTWNKLSQEVRAAYCFTAQESNLTGRDLYMKSFISSYFREGQWD